MLSNYYLWYRYTSSSKSVDITIIAVFITLSTSRIFLMINCTSASIFSPNKKGLPRFFEVRKFSNPIPFCYNSLLLGSEFHITTSLSILLLLNFFVQGRYNWWWNYIDCLNYSAETLFTFPAGSWKNMSGSGFNNN